MEDKFVFTEELAVLNEVHFGKVSGLFKLEEMFNKLRKSYSKSNPFEPSTFKKLIKDPFLMKIGKEISNLFGFKEVAVTFSNTKKVNAYTIPYVSDDYGNVYDLNEHKLPYEKLVGAVKITNSGFMFDVKKFPTTFLICITTGCMFGNDISIPELVAVLLHEVGHTFSLVIMSAKMTGRANENFADQFATMYGYSHELSTFFAKHAYQYSNFDKALKDVPILNVIVGINQIRKGLFRYWDRTSANDPHPLDIDRMKNIVSQLEADLKDTPNLTPTMKKDIEKQIANCKQAIKDTYDPSANANTGERMMKYYYREMEPGFKTEQQRQAQAKTFSAPTKVNQKIRSMMHKKGWFK